MTIPRADVVGSLLRPAYLRAARQGAREGRVAAEALRAAEDSAVREAIALQEAAGLDVITDGELRRSSWVITITLREEGAARAPLAGFEFLCIAERSGSLAYIAMPDARMPATYFYLTALTDSSATFENPAHDFPKLVRYSRLPDGSLQTVISAGPGTRETTITLKKQ